MLYLEDKIAKVLNAIDDVPTQFGYNLDYDDAESIIDWIADCLHSNHIHDFKIDNGVSKMVIIIDGCSEVVKLPFNGYYEPDEYYNEEDEMWENGEEDKWSDFSGADSEFNNDYCESEIRLYDAATEAHVQHMFLETVYAGRTADDTKAYTQTFARNMTCGERKSSASSLEQARTICAGKWGVSGLGMEFIANFLDDYSFPEVMALLAFLKDQNITDLHSGNLMKNVKTNKIVIVDYAGYNS